MSMQRMTASLVALFICAGATNAPTASTSAKSNAFSVTALATLPSLDQLRAKIVGLLQAPATKIAGILQAPAGQLARVVGAYAAKDAA